MRSALITGAASGIGKQLAENLASSGWRITALDIDAAGLNRLAAAAADKGWEVTCVTCDVRNIEAQARAFGAHVSKYGRLDAALLVAGIGERGNFLTADPASYEATLDIDLRAVVTGIRLAATAMLEQEGGGHIISVASAAGYFPVPAGPIYAAAKAGVIHITRSLAPRFAPRGIHISTVCPQYVDTPLVQNMLLHHPDVAKAMMGPMFGKPLLSPQVVVGVVQGLLQRPLPVKGQSVDYNTELAGAGCVYLILQNGTVWDPWEPKGTKKGASKGSNAATSGGSASASSSSSGSSSSAVSRYSPAALAAFAAATAQHLPSSYFKLQVVQLSPDFKQAVRQVEARLPSSVPPGHVLVRRLFVGVNASDINYTSGRYHGSTAAAKSALPYDAGFESVGVVVAVGPPPSSSTSSSSGSSSSGSGSSGRQAHQEQQVAVGQAVATMDAGFSEYGVVPINRLLQVPSPTPEVLALMTSGLTAAIALEQVGGLTIPPPGASSFRAAPTSSSPHTTTTSSSSSKGSKVVLVTAAAGGTGQFAVQLAKLAGCHVVATCGGADKASLLRGLGVDRVINYRSEDVKAVLKSEYPKGVDLVYESVGGSMFDLCVDALAPRGMLIVIGMMSVYSAGWPKTVVEGLPEKLLWKSAAVAGFFLLKYAPLWGPYLQRLVDLVGAGQLAVALDPVPFTGLGAVADAVARLQSGASSGKVVVQLSRELPAVGASAKL